MKRTCLFTGVVVVSMVLTAGNSGAGKAEEPGIMLQHDRGKLVFVDESGKTIKEIELIKPGSEKGMPVVKKKHARLKASPSIKEGRSGDAVVSKNKDFALMIETLTEWIVPETEEEVAAMKDTDKDYFSTQVTIKYFDKQGNVLWEKQPPLNMVVERGALISYDGNVVAYIQTYEMGGLRESEPFERLMVFDKSGKELLVFPERRGEFNSIREMTLSSPSGRYVSFVGMLAQTRPQFVAAFFDLQNKTSWITDEAYYVKRLSDDGSCTVGYTDAPKGTKEINLKEYLEK